MKVEAIGMMELSFTMAIIKKDTYVKREILLSQILNKEKSIN